MITKSTVFLLGAGASLPYGFPSGRKLVEQIYVATQSNIGYEVADIEPEPVFGLTIIRNIMNEVFGSEETARFGKALFLSNQQSIDAFLEHRTEFVEIGKLAITLFIIGNEVENNLFNFKNRGRGCYQYLFSRMNTGWSDFSNNKVSFITFNYDRSLEHFLFTSLQNTYNKSEEDCANQLNKIPIIHLHGAIGKLPWQDKDGISYGGDISDKKHEISNEINRAASRAANQIKIINEDKPTSGEFAKAFNLLSTAEHIYCLGFGYHPVNLERLQILNIPKIREGQTDLIRGTGIGLENSEVMSIQRSWKINIFDTISDSLMFLRRYAILE